MQIAIMVLVGTARITTTVSVTTTDTAQRRAHATQFFAENWIGSAFIQRCASTRTVTLWVYVRARNYF